MSLNSLNHTLPFRPSVRVALIFVAASLAVALTGCGGQDFGGLQPTNNGDIASSYNTSIAGQGGRATDTSSLPIQGSYPMIETSFQLPSVPGDPFDYEKVNVMVTLRKPGGGKVEIPGFFDGDKTWRARYTPLIPGKYTVDSVRLNKELAHEENLNPKEWTVRGDPDHGFVRIDRGDHSRFVYDDGGRYYPIGQNQAWHSSNFPDIPDLFAKMHTAGENWSRVWMSHWDGKNLDWSADGKSSKPGEVNLDVAKKWDTILAAAQKNNIYFQMVLQHHGQYSTQVDPNWNENPYNVKNGGFLQSPQSFFTDITARTLTKRKLYYILSRWGYSPNIMAFELFNEVEGTDAGRSNKTDDIALWHREMSLFLKQYDLNRHLITTSSATAIPFSSPVWETVDYLQVHTYPSDIITALSSDYSAESKKLSKPIFVGEFGPDGLNDPGGVALHNGLWAGIMGSPSGAPQYWNWEGVDQHDLYHQFSVVSGFITASDLAAHGGLIGTTLSVESSGHADLKFGPGGGFAAATQHEFVVGSSGTPPGMDHFPAYLQGQNHHEMMPQPLTFQVSYPQAGSFGISVSQAASAGAHLKVSVDGKATEKEYTAADKDYAPGDDLKTVSVPVSQGAHTITVENTGKDWLRIKRFTFSDYAPALASLARVGKDYLVAWIYHRSNIDAPADQSSALAMTGGKLALPELQSGRYRATWWDTEHGKMLDESDIRMEKGKEGTTISTPQFTRDVALYLAKLSERPEKQKTAKQSRTGSETPVSTAPGSQPTPNSGVTAQTPASSPQTSSPTTGTNNNH